MKRNLDLRCVSVYNSVYSQMKGCVSVTARDAITAALKAVGKTQAEAAQSIGLTPRQFSQRLVGGTLRADMFLELLDEIGVDIEFKARSSGNVISARVHGAGRRVKQMVDSVIYDTANADAISNNFYADGVNEYVDGQAMELYVGADGHYFFAQYTNFDGVKDRIMPVSQQDAATFIEKYGTDLHRKPTESPAES